MFTINAVIRTKSWFKQSNPYRDGNNAVIPKSQIDGDRTQHCFSSSNYSFSNTPFISYVQLTTFFTPALFSVLVKWPINSDRYKWELINSRQMWINRECPTETDAPEGKTHKRITTSGTVQSRQQIMIKIRNKQNWRLHSDLLSS